MFEVDEAAKIITESVDTDANIIFGATINEDYNGELKITVVATGFDEKSNDAYAQAKSAIGTSHNPFGRKSVSDSRVQPASKPAETKEDLDVPAFLRKKM